MKKNKEEENPIMQIKFGLNDGSVILIGFGLLLWFLYSVIEIKLKYGVPWGQ